MEETDKTGRGMGNTIDEKRREIEQRYQDQEIKNGQNLLRFHVWNIYVGCNGWCIMERQEVGLSRKKYG